MSSQEDDEHTFFSILGPFKHEKTNMKRNCWLMLISQFVSEAGVLYLNVSGVTMLFVVVGDVRPLWLVSYI